MNAGADVLIDITRLLGRATEGRLPTGIDRVCLAYLARYGRRAQAVLQWGNWRRVAPYAESQELFALLMEPGRRMVREVTKVIARGCMPPWPSQDAAGRPYLNLGHTGLDHPGLISWLQRTHQRPVFMVHDLIPVTNPEYCRAGERDRHMLRLGTLLRTGAGVITISQCTLDELERFASAQGLPLPPATVAPLAPALPARPAVDAGAPLPHPYFVVLGTIEPRKNHWLLLHLWQQLVAELGDAAPHLVIIGQRGWDCENTVGMLEKCDGLRGVVHELGRCSDSELTAYLTHARALLFPSFAEGYGIPLVEALMLGTPVIASSLPVFREVAGEVPEYLDPLDGPGWSRAVRDYALAASPRREAQLDRIAGFTVPTWHDHFEGVEPLLGRLK